MAVTHQVCGTPEYAEPCLILEVGAYIQTERRELSYRPLDNLCKLRQPIYPSQGIINRLNLYKVSKSIGIVESDAIDFSR